MGCSSGKAAQRQAADPAIARAAAPDTAPAPQASTEPAAEPQQQQQQPEQPANEEDQAQSKQASDGTLLNGKQQKAAAGTGDVVIGFDNDGSPATGVAHAPSAPVIHDPASSPPANASGASAGAREGAATDDGAGGKFDAQGRRRNQSHTVPASFFKPSEHNGFKTMTEAQSLALSEGSMAPYTMPAAALTFEPPPEAIITKFKNGDQERKIYTNTEISPLESERLNALRAEAKAQGAEFYPSVTCMATRFLSRARMDPKKALKLMKDTQDWRSTYFKDGPISDQSLMQDLQHGIVYFTGRDFCLRPAIVIRAARIPQQWYKEKRIDKFIRMLIFCMEYFLRYMVVPGRVENLSVIADLGSLGLSQVPLGALGEVYKVLGHHYIGRVFKFYAVNVSSALSAIAGMAKGFLTDRQKQKLNILDDITELRKEFAQTQLEKDLGGCRPPVQKFFPFPLQPGPYTPGYTGELDETAVTNVHEALSFGGAIGRLWDPKLSAEENARLEYTAKAADIFERCGLPVPPEARLEREGPALASAGSRSAEGLPVESSSGLLAEPVPLVGGQPQKAGTELTPSTDVAEGYRMTSDDCGSPMDDLDLRPDEVIGSTNHEIQSSSVCGGSSLFCCSL